MNNSSPNESKLNHTGGGSVPGNSTLIEDEKKQLEKIKQRQVKIINNYFF